MELHFDKLTLASAKVGTALLRALSEHGLCADGHNAFTFAELHAFYGAPSPMLAGKAIRKYWTPFCLNFASRLPDEFRDVRVNLSGGRLHLQRGAPR